MRPRHTRGPKKGLFMTDDEIYQALAVVNGSHIDDLIIGVALIVFSACMIPIMVVTTGLLMNYLLLYQPGFLLWLAKGYACFMS